MIHNAPERYCAFCGLPLPASFSFGANAAAGEIEYCCSGCRTVASVAESERERGAAANGLLRLGLAIFFTMNVMVFTMALWSQDVYSDPSFDTPLAESLRGVFRWAALLFALPVLYLLDRPIAVGVWQSLRRAAITTDLLILLGVTAAYGYSVVSVLRGSGHVYFEVSAMVLVFVSLGRWLEAKGKRRTGESLDALARLLPETVRRQMPQGKFVETPRGEIHTGDVVRVLPGERFAVDGRIIAGQASVDQQLVTGESRAAAKGVDDLVFSGTLNLDGDLRIEVTAADGSETVSRILKLVRAARSARGRHERLADRIAVWFVPAVCAIAMVAGWQQGQLAGWDQGIMTALAVVLIACPCALGLATPLAVWTALGRAARVGVLFRSGLVLERLAHVQHACFDKTGTLTTGSPGASELIVPVDKDRRHVLQVAAHLAVGSTHPLSRSIAQFVRWGSEGLLDLEPVSVETLPGRGLAGNLPGLGRVVLGSRRLMREEGLEWPESFTDDFSDDSQQVGVGWNGMVRGVFKFHEQLRPETGIALEECRQLGLDLRMLTGDEQGKVDAIVEQLNISAYSNQLPEEKASTLRSLANEGGVAMVGDGLNDAPALATADVGVALGCGADVSRDAAGVCLLGDDLRRFPWAVALARQTVSVMKQNLFWAFAYNVAGIALAATGRLNPIWAALAMAASSILVVVNSLRLSHFAEPVTFSEASDETRATNSTLQDAVDWNPKSSDLQLVSMSP